jgi:hypothetical protein
MVVMGSRYAYYFLVGHPDQNGLGLNSKVLCKAYQEGVFKPNGWDVPVIRYVFCDKLNYPDTGVPPNALRPKGEDVSVGTRYKPNQHGGMTVRKLGESDPSIQRIGQ